VPNFAHLVKLVYLAVVYPDLAKIASAHFGLFFATDGAAGA